MILLRSVIATAFFLPLIILDAGCSTVKVRFADAPLERLDLAHARAIRTAAKRFYFLSFFPIGPEDRHVAAYERLMAAAGTDYITDIRIQESWSYCGVGTLHSTALSAIACPDIKDAPTHTLTARLSELKALRDKGELSSVEYETARKKILEK